MRKRLLRKRRGASSEGDQERKVRREKGRREIKKKDCIKGC